MLHRKKSAAAQTVSILSERKQRIYDFLHENPVGVLSTVDPDGNPHGVVIYFTISKDFVVCFLTKSETKKYDNIKHHPRVMLTVCAPDKQTTVQVAGNAVELFENSEINRIAGAVQNISLQMSKPKLLPITKLDAGDYVAFKIEPVDVHMAVYAKSEHGEPTNMFESVESFELNGPA